MEIEWWVKGSKLYRIIESTWWRNRVILLIAFIDLHFKIFLLTENFTSNNFAQNNKYKDYNEFHIFIELTKPLETDRLLYYHIPQKQKYRNKNTKPNISFYLQFLYK